MKNRTKRKPPALPPRKSRPLKADPTRTGPLVRRVLAAAGAKFDALKAAVLEKVRAEDALGVGKRPNPFATVTTNTQWAFNEDDEKVRAFKVWLESQLAQTIAANDADDLWRKFVEDGFRQGAGRAFDDANRAGAVPAERLNFYNGTRDEFLRSSFGRPESVTKVKLLAARTLDEMKGVTAEAATRMVRTLAEGLVRGQGPYQIARTLAADVNLSRTRAELVARTEIVRAHAEGQLAAFEQLGVTKLGVQVEWSTAGDGRVCKKCRPLNGKVMTIDQARGKIPYHPRCRCAWVPAGVGESRVTNANPKGCNQHTGPNCAAGTGADPNKNPVQQAETPYKNVPYARSQIEDALRGATLIDRGWADKFEDVFGKDADWPVVSLPPAKLRRSQDWLVPEKSADVSGPLDPKRPILVVRHGGLYHVEDGNHRAAHAIRTGQTVPARVVEFDAAGKLVPVADAVENAVRTRPRPSPQEPPAVPTSPDEVLTRRGGPGRVVFGAELYEFSGFVANLTHADEWYSALADVLLGVFGPDVVDLLDPAGLTENYDPRQPRDRNGRWGKTAGTGWAEDKRGYFEFVSRTVGDMRLAGSFGGRSNANRLVNQLSQLSVAELKQLAATHKLKAGTGRKAELVERLKAGLTLPVAGGRPKPEPKQPDHVPGTRFMPGRPIGERLAAYKGADAVLKAVTNAVGKSETAQKAADDVWKKIKAHDLKMIQVVNDVRMSESEKDAALSKLRKTSNSLHVEHQNLQGPAQSARIDTERILNDMLRVPESERARWTDAEPSNPIPANHPVSGRAKTAANWMKEKVAAGEESLNLSIATNAHEDFVDGRAHAYPRYVALAASNTVGVGVHEYAHCLEFQIRDGVERSKEFLDHRCGAEPFTNLSDKFGGFDSHEKGRKDDFDKAFPGAGAYYVGKHYAHATEVLSMGVQKLYEDPGKFATADPEYFKFVVGMLNGDLR